jgi:hypothetical protein
VGRFDSISSSSIEIAKFADCIRLILLQIKYLKIFLLGLVIFAKFSIAKASHEVNLKEFRVLIDHNF